jgi:cyclic di-GMP phosphodiesterase
MSIKKIKINQLKIGMYITGLDISWIRSPFLKHSRLIKEANDIKLLIEAGVKEVTIDTNNGIGVIENTDNNQTNKTTDSNKTHKTSDITAQENNTQLIEDEPESKASPQSTKSKKSTSLIEELDSALILKAQACEAFTNLSKIIKSNKPLVMNEVMPIIDESINSLIRNNQALLTLMHMRRSEKDLFSHSFSTMSLLLSIAMSLNYSPEQLRKLGIAALLHDLGWSKIPLHLLSKNKTYTNSEKKIVQQHLLIVVQQLLADKNNENEVVKLISQHHERGDGSGYPKGLELKDLSEDSSLLALIDYYDELIHGLLDRSGVIPSLALKFLYKEALKGKFHKKHVEQLINLLGIYPLTSAVKLASGEKGVVIATNRSEPLKPCIKIIYDNSGRAIVQPYVIDLTNDEQAREISQVLDVSEPKNDPLQLLVVTEEKVTANG